MTRHVPFGVGLWGMQATRLNPVPHQHLYQELITDAEYAEELGFASFWTTEHHFWYDGYCPTPQPVLAAIADRTERLRLCTGMVLLPLHDPMRIAESAATVDAMSQGRAEVGVALGYRDVEFDGLGLHRRQRPRRMDEQLEVLISAFSGKPVNFSGRHFRYQGAGLTPPPHRTPVPVWVAATSAAATARAARLGLPVMFGSTLSAEAVARLVEHYRVVAAEHGQDPNPGFTQSLTMWISDSPRRAQDIVPRLRYLLREQLGGWRYLKDADGQLVGFDRPADLDRAVESALDVCVVGDPDQGAAAIETLLAAGLTEIVCRVKFDGTDRDASLECFRLIAEEIMPRFQ